MKKTVLYCLILALLCMFASSCGAEGKLMNNIVDAREDGYYKTSTEGADYSGKYESGGTPDADMLTETGEKIIYSVNLSLETMSFDETVSSLDALVSSFNGYILHSDVNGDTYYNSDGTSRVINRHAKYEIAVPAQSFDDALAEAEKLGNVTNKERTAENVTSQYTDVAARLESLRIQEEHILAMMDESDDIGALITLEERLSEIMYQKESYQRQMDNLERRIAYSTITVSVREVSTYSPTVSATRSFGERLSDAFSDGWTSFLYGWQDFLVWFAEALPGLILFAVIVIALIVVIRLLSRRLNRRKKEGNGSTVSLQSSVPTLAEIEARKQKQNGTDGDAQP